MQGEIRPGYKQTEVGVIPEDWEAPTLGVLKTLMTNGFVGTATRHYERNERGVLYIQGYNVEENSFNFNGIKYVTEEFHKLHMKSCLKAGDLLTVQTGDVGLTTFVPESLSGANCHALIITRFDARKVHSKFVSYYLNGDEGRTRLRLIETGTTMKHLNVGDMLQFVVPLPPLPEQQAIAAALSDADALIAALEGMIAKKRDLKQAAMQHLLTGKTRLPGFSGEWGFFTLDEACIKIQDGTHFSPKMGGTDFQYITSKNVAFGRMELAQVERISAAEHAKIYARCSVRKGDLLLTKDGANTGNAAVNILEEPISLLSSVAFLRLDEDRHNTAFFLYQILSAEGQRQIIGEMSGNAITRLTLRKIRALGFRAPYKPEQTAIAEVLSDMDADLAALEAQVAKARAVKQGMMQELLTGKVRLK